MKRMIAFGVLCILFCCCKKEVSRTQIVQQDPMPPGFYARALKYLRANLNDSDYVRLDTGRLLVNLQDDEAYLRVPLVHDDLSSDFILLQTDTLGNGNKGVFIHFDRSPSSGLQAVTLHDQISGIRIQGLRHENGPRQFLTNGKVTPECATNNTVQTLTVDAGADVVPGCSDCLPEVIVYGYKPASGGISYGEYLNLASLVNGYSAAPSGVGAGAVSGPSSGPGSGGSLGGVYSSLGGSTSSSGSSGQGPAKPVATVPQAITINYEQSSGRPAIDVASFMKCFASLPDAGSTCAVTVYVDLPVNDNPAYIFNILTGATGHCFLQLSKTNGSQTVTQFIGFTTSKPLAILGLPVTGKIVDNAGHKYNASLTMPLTPVQLAAEIQAINKFGSNHTYDMWEYNCVNFAADMLNAVRPSNPLRVIQLNDITSGDSYSTPQGLYLTLEQMKEGSEAKNILTGVVQNAGVSHGACQ